MGSQTRAESQKPRSLKWSISVYIVTALFLCLEMALQVSPSVMASGLMNDLALSAFGLGVMSGFYFYTYTAMQIPSGLLFDQYNPRLILIVSILTCAAGALLFSMSSSIYTGCLARLLMGAGSAFAFVATLVVTNELFHPRHFATITGITQMLAALGAMMGQFPVSILVSSWGWRLTMQSEAAIGVVLIIAAWLLLSRYQKHHHQETPTNEAGLAQRMKKVVQRRQSWTVAVYACLLWAPMSGFASLWGVPFLEHTQHMNEHMAALLCSLMWLGLALGSPLLGALSTRYRTRVIPLFAAPFVGGITFVLIQGLMMPPYLIAAMLMLAGASCSGQALSFSVVKENNDRQVSATAIAFNNMAVVISGAIFQPLIGQLLSLGGMSGMLNYSIAGTVIMLCYLAASAVAIVGIKEPDNVGSVVAA